MPLLTLTRRTLLGSSACILIGSGLRARGSTSLGFDLFLDPPASARPRVWWHWMDENVSSQGIAKDLAWMHRVGIRGVQMFDAGFGAPQIVAKPIIYRSPEWAALVRQAVRTASAYDMEFAVASSPGWSTSGGPWVKPEQGMKKLVWSETILTGGRPMTGPLPEPAPLPRDNGWGNIPSDLYVDEAVLAFPVGKEERDLNDLSPIVTSSAGSVSLAAVNSGKPVELPFQQGDVPSWILLAFSQPQRLSALTWCARLATRPARALGGQSFDAWLQASDDGISFRNVTQLSAADSAQEIHGPGEQTVSFSPVRARYFRILMMPRRVASLAIVDRVLANTAPSHAHLVSRLLLHGGTRVSRFQDKSGQFSVAPPIEKPADLPKGGIARTSVIDLSDRLRGDGTLDWIPPAGQWLVMRFGYRPTGDVNHPTSAHATGLEVDKLNAAMSRLIWNHISRFWRLR